MTIGVTSVIYVAMWYFAFLIEERIVHRMKADTQNATVTVPHTAPFIHAPHLQPESKTTIETFLKRLGPDAGSRLIRLTMSDHYIEAHTDKGMHMLYMRFADAIDALSTANRTQAHRSHWVNLDEVKTTEKDGSKLFFILSDGSKVPISRSRKKELQTLGLI